MKRVAITGVGAVSPLGLDAKETWRAACAGESGIGWISTFDTDGLPVRVAGEVKGFDPTTVVSPKEARKLERNVLLGVAAGREALDDAKPERLRPDARRDHLRLGDRRRAGHPRAGTTRCASAAPTASRRTSCRTSSSTRSPGQLAISLGISGPNYAVVSACATGSHAVGEAAEMIKRGAADAVLAGGTESCIVPLILAGFTAMRGLAAEDEHPPHASRPFDATRAGFVMSEGAGALLLEDWDSAEARGADIYAEVLGYGASNDAHHMAQPEPEATGVAAMMRGALERAERRTASASATSTRTAPPPRSATPPRRRRSRTSSATTPTSSPSRRRSR